MNVRSLLADRTTAAYSTIGYHSNSWASRGRH